MSRFQLLAARGACLATIVVFAPLVARGDIIGVAPLTGSAFFKFKSGGTLFSSSSADLERYPSSTIGGPAADPPTGFGLIDVAYDFSPHWAKVFIPDNGPVAIASQPAPAPFAGALEAKAEFYIVFETDGAGTPATTISIVYPIAWGQTAPGMFNSFDAVINYTSAALGPLGTSELHFSQSGVGGSPYELTYGPDLALPALPAFDMLALDGYFTLVADGFTDGSTEIEVFGVPEPSAITLALVAVGVCLARVARRRRCCRTRAPWSL